jgi:hypothetical protein
MKRGTTALTPVESPMIDGSQDGDFPEEEKTWAGGIVLQIFVMPTN